MLLLKYCNTQDSPHNNYLVLNVNSTEVEKYDLEDTLKIYKLLDSDSKIS